jgi:hypothetical protein
VELTSELQVVRSKQKKEDRQARRQLPAQEADKEAMVRLRREHREIVQAKMEFDHTKKNRTAET